MLSILVYIQIFQGLSMKRIVYIYSRYFKVFQVSQMFTCGLSDLLLFAAGSLVVFVLRVLKVHILLSGLSSAPMAASITGLYVIFTHLQQLCWGIIVQIIIQAPSVKFIEDSHPWRPTKLEQSFIMSTLFSVSLLNSLAGGPPPG